jgi:hypothetical protein
MLSRGTNDVTSTSFTVIVTSKVAGAVISCHPAI